MTCALCGRRLPAGRYVRSGKTGRRCCADFDRCDVRAGRRKAVAA
jgi:hypothetical protein